MFMQLMNFDRLFLLLWILLYLLLFCIKFTTYYGRVFTLESCTDVLRPLTVPSWNTWMPGTCTGNCMTMSISIGLTKTYKDKMRSILAQYEYHKMILEYPLNTTFMLNEVTKEPFHDRENEGHTLQ